MTAGLAFLFIHGAGGTSSKWRLLRQRLNDVDKWFIDLPGHGPDTGTARNSIESYASGLSEQLSQDVVVVGHSMGGLIGLELSKMSKHVKALVLVASHYRLPVHEKILSRLREGAFPNSLFYASYSKNAPQALIEEERAEIPLVSTQTTLLDYECCNRYDTGKETLSKLDIPVHVLYGAQDKLLPYGAKDEMLEANPRIRTETVPDTAHYVMLERPIDTANHLRTILAGLE